MTQEELIQSLKDYSRISPSESEAALKLMEWIDTYGDFAFVRENLAGHLTGSLMVTNTNHTKVLLMFHHKLQMWLQFGGHADGEVDIVSVALREFHEESGITEEPRIIGDIFDVDVHTIPARPTEPEHLHLDILFLAEIDEGVSMEKEEGKVEDLKWIDIDSIEEYTDEERMLRMVDKIRNLH